MNFQPITAQSNKRTNSGQLDEDRKLKKNKISSNNNTVIKIREFQSGARMENHLNLTVESPQLKSKSLKNINIETMLLEIQAIKTHIKEISLKYFENDSLNSEKSLLTPTLVEEITKYINSNNINIKNLRQLIHSLDVLIFWNEWIFTCKSNLSDQSVLCKHIRQSITYNSINQLINVPKDFSRWINEYQNGCKNGQIPFQDTFNCDFCDQLYSSIPDEIQLIKNLKTLFLTKQKLKTFPNSLFLIKKLETLDISDNMLTSLPKELEKFTNLKELYISENELEKFPEEICNLENLEVLDISKNKIKSLPAQFSKLKKLQELHLDCELAEFLINNREQLDHLDNIFLYTDNKSFTLPEKKDWKTNRDIEIEVDF